MLTQVQQAYVIPELHTPILLGYDWLRKHNPRIDWRAGRIVLPQHAVEF